MLSTKDFNSLDFVQQCRVLKRFGRFHSYGGLANGNSINLYEVEGLMVELWLDAQTQVVQRIWVRQGHTERQAS